MSTSACQQKELCVPEKVRSPQGSMEWGGRWQEGVEQERAVTGAGVGRLGPGGSGIGSSCTCHILSLFPGLICFTRTCTSYLAQAGLSRPVAAAAVDSGAKGQISPSLEEAVNLPSSPIGGSVAPAGPAVSVQRGWIGLGCPWTKGAMSRSWVCFRREASAWLGSLGRQALEKLLYLACSSSGPATFFSTRNIQDIWQTGPSTCALHHHMFRECQGFGMEGVCWPHTWCPCIEYQCREVVAHRLLQVPQMSESQHAITAACRVPSQ